MTTFLAIFRGSGDINVFQNTPGLTSLHLRECGEVIGKEDSRTVRPPLDDRVPSTSKSNRFLTTPHPAFLAHNKPGDKEAIKRALPGCTFHL